MIVLTQRLLLGLCAGVLLPCAALALSPPVGTAIRNRAKADYFDANKTTPLSTESQQVETIVTARCNMIHTVTALPNPASPGQEVTFIVQYSNIGNTDATNGEMVLTLDPLLEFQSASNGGQSVPGEGARTRVKWTLSPAIAPGEGGRVTVDATVKPDAPEGVVLNADMRITADEGVCEDRGGVEVGEAPKLFISKTAGRDSVAPTGTITYTLTYRNTGNKPAASAVIRDQLPDKTVYVPGSATDGGTLEGRTLVWRLGDIGQETEGTVEFTVEVLPTAKDGLSLRNVATILSAEHDPVLSNAVKTPVSSRPRLVLLKMDDDDPVWARDTVEYTLRVTNESPTATLNNVLLRDELPPQTSFVSADNGGQHSGQYVIWDLGDIAPRQTIDIRLTLKTDFGTCQNDPDAVLLNAAEVTADNSAPGTATETTTVRGRTRATVEFIDQLGGDPVNAYGINTDTIYVRVTDEDHAGKPAVDVTLTLDTSDGDTETITLDPTGQKPGEFEGSIPRDRGTPTADDGIFSLRNDSRLKARYTDSVYNNCVTAETTLIDPFGIVFDSVTGEPVAGATVTLLNDATGLPADLSAAATGLAFDQDNPVITGATGSFRFQFVPAGNYRLSVAIDPARNYVFPSVMPLAELQTRHPDLSIHDQWSRNQSFPLVAGLAPLNVDIPVDPPAGTHLTVEKSANRTTAAIGDLVTYRIKVTNSSGSDVNDIDVIDTMPRGIHYMENSTRIDGAASADPAVTSGRTLRWRIPVVRSGTTATVTYKATIGVNADRGKVKNTAYANIAGVRGSNTDMQEINITEGVFTSRGTIIGKVFNDVDGDRMQGEGEKGLAGVTLYTQDGTWVVTDQFGKYSIPGVKPGTHVVRVDPTTLPKDTRLESLHNRFMGDPASQFVDMQPGGLHKADFAVAGTGKNRKVVISDTDRATSGTDTDTAAAERPVPEDTAAQVDLEEALKGMSSEFAILSPAEGAVLSRDSTDIRTKVPLGSKVKLDVNGRPVPSDKIGRRMTYKPGRVALFEYVGVELRRGKENRITATMTDPFGNVRGSRSITVRTVGKPDQLKIAAEPSSIPADGRSTLQITAEILDRNELRIGTRRMISVETTGGLVVEEDADPANLGHQIRCTDGLARFSLRAPREAGTGVVTMTFDDVTAELDVTFTPHMRDMFMVGVGEITFGHGHTSGDFDELRHSDGDWFEDEAYAGGRGALFLKGRLAEDTLLTAAYDTHKEEREDFFREDDRDVDDEELYPIYGDDSERGYEAQSRDKLYLRVDRDRSYLLYGDYHTDLSETRLSAHQRTFTGLKTEIKTDRLEIKAFGADTDQTQALDAIPGRGISGYYYLNHQDVVEGSETVYIEIRDRLRATRVLNRENKTRQSDYEIDYDFGRLLFKEPVPSHDANLNPVYIVVSYETRDEGEKYYTYGGRTSLKVTEALTLGATGIVTETGVGNETLLGADMTLKLPADSVLKAEMAQSEGRFTIDGLPSLREGTAWSVELESKPVEGLTLKPYIIDADDYFLNPSAADVDRGTRKQGIDAEYELNPSTTLTAQAIDEQDRLNETSYRRTSAGVQQELGNTTLGFEMIQEESDQQYRVGDPATARYPLEFDSDEPTARSPFDISEETADETVAAKFAIDTRLRENLSLQLGHQHDLKANRHNISHAGLTLNTGRGSRLYLREQYAKYEERSETRTILGIETEVAKNTVGFNEYRIIGGMGGSATQQSIGLRNKLALGDRLTGNLSVENLKTLRGRERKSEDDGFAAAAALEYLARENVKLSTRLEHRNTTAESSYLAEFGLVTKVNRDFSALLKTRHFTDLIDDQGRRNSSRLLFGLAYRPVDNDRFNALTKFEYRHDEDHIADPGTDTDSYIVSTDGIYQLSARTQLIGKYAGKFAKYDGVQSYTDLVSARVVHDLTDRFDCSVGYRVLHSYDAHTLSQGGSAELGYRVWKNLWLAVGYSVDKFDADLTGGDYQGEGPYLRLRFKFDENTFRRQTN